MDAAGHQVVACALGRARGEDGGLELREAGRDHATANARDHLGAERDIAVQLLAPQVEEAVAQPRVLGELGVARHLERESLRARLHAKLVHRQLHLPGGELEIDRVRAARHHGAGHGHHALRPQGGGGLEEGAAGTDHALGDAVMVAEVHEQELAVITLAMHPPGQPGGLPDVGSAELPAGMGPIRVHHARVPFPVNAFTVT
jgi:hypothetical protein